jgi:hypothetical protein
MSVGESAIVLLGAKSCFGMLNRTSTKRRLILAALFVALAYSKRYPVISERKRLST